ncbi:glycosyltransferase family protein [Mucilaginibacter boryungensis]|uniref:Glycosyltransferase n=1 Tax=Mucilaginibacter boryungensis TaxID=768480 RepID=A0ABR9XF25_9SPHI|nr:glycosyltransferase [Mucilaginibacter boryungensis]MBE9665991.1 glycosyltransferase [Mucilaginibacter boryungensis]
MQNKKHVVLVSSGQPSLNPRLVKEADSLAQAGFKVTVLYAYWNAWGTQLDKELLKTKQWQAVRTGGDPETKTFTYLLTRILFKISNWFTRLTGSMLMAEVAIARNSLFLIKKTKTIRADLYIGHYPGALAAVVKAAKKHHKPCGFDAEDFHRKEVNDNENSYDYKLKSYIENKYIPQVNYLSASSVQIGIAYHTIFKKTQPVVLNNVFPKSTLNVTNLVLNDEQPVKLFWFSQVIGPNRGLEYLCKALNLTAISFEVHLLGYCDSDYKTKLQAAYSNITFHPPTHPDNIIEFASQFDIGLALEIGFSVNNNLALSNKIFTYMQAGLAIIASNTEAQEYLLKQHPAIGKVYDNSDIETLASALVYYHQNRNELLLARQAALQLAHQEYNWENESQKFLAIVKKTLAD